MKKKFELIIFDMDGTLYPNCEEFNATYPKVSLDLVSKNRRISPEEANLEFEEKKKILSQEIGGQATNTLTLLKYYDVTFEEFENAVNENIEIEKLLKYDSKTAEIIRLVSSEYKVALYTTNVDKCTERILNHLKLSEFFPHENRFTISTMGRLPVSREEQLTYIKPGKNGFRMILEKFNVSPNKVLMIGDSMVSDIAPAKTMGINTYKIDSINSLYNLPDWLEIKN